MYNQNPYMVHSMTPKAGLITMVAAWLTGVPLRIHTFTGLVWPTAIGFRRKVLMATDWLTCICATHIIPEGQGVLEDLKQYRVCNKPMKVLGYGNVKGIDMEVFNPFRFSSVNKDQNIFRYVYVGRIVGDKGINELVQAFLHLNTDYPSTQLILVGQFEADLDPVKPDVLEIIKNNPCIYACGPKYGDSLIVEYLKSDCFVLPSYREGFPNTVLEAGALGLPSIVTDINGSREIIINGVNGIIIPSKNIDALYEAMKQMLTNDSARAQMAKNARIFIKSRFEKKFVQDCLIDFYSGIFNRSL